MSTCDCPECTERRRVEVRDAERFVEGLLSAAIFGVLVVLAFLWFMSGGS